MKPGWKTSEFWIALLMQLAGVGVITGHLTTEQIQLLQESGIVPLASGIFMAIGGAAYIWGRSWLKSKTGV